MMERCVHCNASRNLIDGAILWLCPVCGEYGAVKSFVQEDKIPTALYS